MKKAFSLAEVMIVLVIIGVISAITIPSLVNDQSKNYMTLYKSAYRLVEATVNEETNDLNAFPSGTLNNALNASNNYTLCNDFATRLNTIGTVNCASGAMVVPGTPSFITTNGMRWYFPNNTTITTVTPLEIEVDIDGANQGANTDSTTNCTRDILRVDIYSNGKINVPSVADACTVMASGCTSTTAECSYVTSTIAQ